MYKYLRLLSQVTAFSAVAYTVFKVSPIAGAVLAVSFVVYNVADTLELYTLAKQYNRYNKELQLEDELYGTKGNC